MIREVIRSHARGFWIFSGGGFASYVQCETRSLWANLHATARRDNYSVTTAVAAIVFVVVGKSPLFTWTIQWFWEVEALSSCATKAKRCRLQCL
jgi:hypothetical protein